MRSEAVKQKGIMAVKVLVDVDEAKDVHRTWPEVRDIVTAGGLPARAEGRALAAFEKLAAAEAKVHGVAIDEIHFHEVGCVDAIVDHDGEVRISSERSLIGERMPKDSPTCLVCHRKGPTSRERCLST